MLYLVASIKMTHYQFKNKFSAGKIKKISFSLFSLVNGQNLWILSRRKILEPQFMERALSVLNVNSLSRLYLKHTEQNCIERPERPV